MSAMDLIIQKSDIGWLHQKHKGKLLEINSGEGCVVSDTKVNLHKTNWQGGEGLMNKLNK